MDHNDPCVGLWWGGQGGGGRVGDWESGRREKRRVNRSPMGCMKWCNTFLNWVHGIGHSVSNIPPQDKSAWELRLPHHSLHSTAEHAHEAPAAASAPT
jgi:hypothetical protein